MVRHTVLLKLTDSATDADRSAIVEALAALPAQIPAIGEYVLGVDIGLDGENYDLAVTADFADVGDYRSYAAHPAHLAVIRDHIRPVLAARTAVQFEF